MNLLFFFERLIKKKTPFQNFIFRTATTLTAECRWKKLYFIIFILRTNRECEAPGGTRRMSLPDP